MYARRYQRPKTNPLTIVAAAAINVGLVALIATSAPTIGERVIDTIKIRLIPLDQPTPEPLPPKPVEKVETARPDPKPLAPDPMVPVPQPDLSISTTDIIVDTPIVTDAVPLTPGPANGAVVVDPPKPAPVLVDARIDPRAVFQPDYPAAERRAGTEGSVTIRVLIGTDGRVKAVEQVRAASAAFFEATRRQALSGWRFKPATRDGVAVESWQVKTVRFVMES